MRGRRIAAFVLLAVLVAGCTSTTSGTPTTQPTPTHHRTSSSSSSGSDPAPTTSPASTSTPPTVPTTGPNVRPGETVPTLPSVAKSNSSAGAVEFASYWLKTLDWGYSTTSPTLLSESSAQSCLECARFAKIFTAAKDHGQHFQGGHLSAIEFRIADPGGHDAATEAVDITYRQQPVRLVDSSNNEVRRAAGLPHEIRRIWLGRNRGTWIVLDTKQVVVK